MFYCEITNFTYKHNNMTTWRTPLVLQLPKR
jgi:hypothetical protein